DCDRGGEENDVSASLLPHAPCPAASAGPATTTESTQPAATGRPSTSAAPIPRNERTTAAGITVTAKTTRGAHCQQKYDKNEKENQQPRSTTLTAPAFTHRFSASLVLSANCFK